MTNCDPAHSAERVVKRIFGELDENRIRREIDDRIEKAASAFARSAPSACSEREFRKTIGEFVAHVYKNGLSAPQSLSSAEARTEAISLLDRNYRGTYDAGYDAAVLDSLSSARPGLHWAFSGLAEAIRLQQRQNHSRRVFVRHLAPCSWAMKCRIVEHLIERSTPFLTADLLHCRPAQLVDEIPALVSMQLSTGG